MFASLSVCPQCESRIPDGARLCPSCDPSPVSVSTAGTAGHRPPIYITAHHFARIEHLAHIELSSGHPARDLLIEKLARARICLSKDMPADVVTMNARILFSVDAMASETRVLVYPEAYHPTGQYVSLGSPLGAALLGLAGGDEADFIDRQGRARRVRVGKVAYQPEVYDQFGR